MEVDQYSNEELVVKYQGGNDYAATVLWEQIYPLTQKWINKKMASTKYHYEDLIDMAHDMYTSTLKLYKTDSTSKYTTYYWTSMDNKLRQRLKLDSNVSRSGMKVISADAFFKSEITSGDYNEGKYLAIEDQYSVLDNPEQIYVECLEYALTKVKPKYQEHLRYYFLIDNTIKQQHIANAIEKETGEKCPRESVRRNIENVKKYFLSHLKEMEELV